MGQFLNNLQSKFVQFCPDEAARVVPCSEEDINELENNLSIRLPLTYREYLLWMGRGGSFLSSAHCFYQSLPDINQSARDMVVQSKRGIQLPNNAFVFAFDVSPLFYFFRIGEGDDPPVYLYMEPELKEYHRASTKENYTVAWAFLFDDRVQADFILFSPSFTKFLEYELDEYIRLKQQFEVWRESRKSRGLASD